MKMILLFGSFTLFMVMAIIFLGMWTYRDAKNRGLDPAKWAAIVVLVPNLMGLIIYFIVGRGEERVNCSNCNSKVHIKSKYCMNCGNEIDRVGNSNVNQDEKPTKALLIGFIVSLIVMLIIFMGIGYMVFTEDDFEFNSGISIGSIQNNIGNKWNVSYNISDKRFSSTIRIKDNSPSTLFIESSHRKGELSVKLVQGALEEIINLSQERNNYEFDLSIFDEGKVKIYLIGKDTRNVKFKSYWE